MLRCRILLLLSRRENTFSSVPAKRDFACQLPVEGYNFFNCSEVNAEDLNPTAKSGCGRGPFTQGIDLCQLSLNGLDHMFEVYSSAKMYGKFGGGHE